MTTVRSCGYAVHRLLITPFLSTPYAELTGCCGQVPLLFTTLHTLSNRVCLRKPLSVHKSTGPTGTSGGQLNVKARSMNYFPVSGKED